jgi:hypothetical protein
MASARSKLIVRISAALLVMFLLAFGYIALTSQDAFEQRVQRQVRADIPVGTTRNQAETWITQKYIFLPTYRTAHVKDGPLPLEKRAGVPEFVPGGVIGGLAKPSDLIGQGVDRLHPNHVWFYLLLDQNGFVQDYRFFSFNELRKIEAKEALASK